MTGPLPPVPARRPRRPFIAVARLAPPLATADYGYEAWYVADEVVEILDGDMSCGYGRAAPATVLDLVTRHPRDDMPGEP